MWRKKRQRAQKVDESSVGIEEEEEGGGGRGYDDLEAIGDGVRSTDGWMVVGWLGGWLSAGSKGGAHSSFRGTVALGG